MKVGQCKKKPNEQITLACAHQKMNDKKFSQKGMVAKKKELNIKKIQKVGTIGRILHKAPKRWFFKRWC
jgi:hypothetical protein